MEERCECGRCASHTLSQDATLGLFVEPMSAEHFLQKHWLVMPLLVPRARGDHFSGLFDWAALNTILNSQQPLPPRLRLWQEGQEIAAARYLTPSTGWRKAVLNTLSLETLLRDGATLVINAIDEIHEPMRRAIESLEKTFHFPIHANLYAAWAQDGAFPLHWDDQDTFIVQVEGSKRWTVYSPTAATQQRNMEPSPPLPTGEADIDVKLQAGQTLYLPKGWWHRVTPLGEPSLHLTVTCEAPSAADLVRWALGEIAAHGATQFAIPREQDRDFLDRVINDLAGELRKPNVIASFWGQSEARLPHRAPLRLPDLRSR